MCIRDSPRPHRQRRQEGRELRARLPAGAHRLQGDPEVRAGDHGSRGAVHARRQHARQGGPAVHRRADARAVAGDLRGQDQEPAHHDRGPGDQRGEARMTAPRAHREGFGHVAGLGARSVTAGGLLAGTLVTMWRMERFRSDYWAQLSPWVTFVAGGFAVLAGTLVFVYWRLAERSHSYLRFGEKLPFGDETSLLAARGRSLVVGRAPFVEAVDLPPRATHALYVA